MALGRYRVPSRKTTTRGKKKASGSRKRARTGSAAPPQPKPTPEHSQQIRAELRKTRDVARIAERVGLGVDQVRELLPAIVAEAIGDYQPVLEELAAVERIHEQEVFQEAICAAQIESFNKSKRPANGHRKTWDANADRVNGMAKELNATRREARATRRQLAELVGALPAPSDAGGHRLTVELGPVLEAFEGDTPRSRGDDDS